ncbi:MAG: two component transcriptional regulator, winged helix family [Candidatus Eremiobacteraeota bacterium]|jgi:DNA-binding response OmpR family regulator|nr:two component transcriptional regulator, winged helix family [Candidatus Eremiobacteraeota bacterium]
MAAIPKVVVIDDERHLRELLELGLGEDGFEVRSAADGRAGLALVRDWRPDAIVLDVMLPFVDGLELLPMLRRITEAPILMLSAKADTDDRITGLRRGADDYIPKPFEMTELAARLHSALRRPRLEQPSIVAYADLSIDLDRREVKRGDQRIELSAREYALLLTLVRNPERVFTRDQLLDLVWGTDRDVGPGAVETYVSYLRAKIDAGFDPKLIRTIRGAGYALRTH